MGHRVYAIMDARVRLFGAIVVVVSLFHNGLCATSYASVKSDYEALLNAYQTSDSVPLQEIIPKDSMTSPITVYLGMELYAVMDFDGVKGELTLVTALSFEWQDDIKTITGTNFNGNLQTILVDYNKIWNPNLVLMNDAQSVQRIGDLSYKVRYNTSSGYCKWKPRLIINAACTPDMTFYPFDEQLCTLTVTPWFRDQSKIAFSMLTNEWKTDDMDESGIWSLSQTSSSSYIENGNPFVDFTIVIKRKPLFLSIVLVLPVLLLSLLTGFLFLLPPGSGERTGFGITCFLSFVVVLQVLMQFLPETSVRMSILCYYIICMLMFSAGLSIVNMLILRMYLSPSAGQIPAWLLFLVKIARCIPCRLCYRRCKCRRKLKACCRRCCATLILPVCRYCRKRLCVCWKKYGMCRCICHEERSHDFITNIKFNFGQKHGQREPKSRDAVLYLRTLNTGLRSRSSSSRLSQVSPMENETSTHDTTEQTGRTIFNINSLEGDNLSHSSSSSGFHDGGGDYTLSSANSNTTRMSASYDSGELKRDSFNADSESRRYTGVQRDSLNVDFEVQRGISDFDSSRGSEVKEKSLRPEFDSSRGNGVKNSFIPDFASSGGNGVKKNPFNRDFESSRGSGVKHSFIPDFDSSRGNGVKENPFNRDFESKGGATRFVPDVEYADESDNTEEEVSDDEIDEVENTPAFLAALTWELIAKILDVFFIIVFVTVQTVFTLIFLIPLFARY